MTDFDLLIAQYERRNLDGMHPGGIVPARILDGLEFVRVTGLAAFWRSDGAGSYSSRAVDLAISAHGWGTWFSVVIAGSGDQIEVYVAVANAGTTVRLLQSAYPGLQCDALTVTDLGSRLGRRFAYSGVLSGVPSPRYEREASASHDKDETAHLSRIVRGMRGSDWIYAIRAWPKDPASVRSHREAILRVLNETLPHVRQSMQRTLQETRSSTDSLTNSMSEVRGGEIVDPEAEYAVGLLNQERERIDDALAYGQWQVAVDYGAADEMSARRLGGLLKGIFAGDSESSDRVRVDLRRGTPDPVEPDTYHTLLSSREVGSLIEFPQEEAPGFGVREFVKFGLDGTRIPTGKPDELPLGQVLYDDTVTALQYSIPLEDLRKHALVAGVTGAGKTTTVRGILRVVHDAGLPFLVLEPAKTEYRALLAPGSGKSAHGTIAGLRIYTLGNDQIAPFRINPFEFETDDQSGGSLLLGHIDLLKSAFNSAFILYAPMPYVLESALYQVYEDKGWNLVSGQNLLLPAGQWKQRHRYNIFPTLTDLYRKVEVVTRRLGYEARIERDVIAGLRARIDTLRVGSKGLMMDVPRGKPMADLLAESAVLELEYIGSDNQKAFIIGLLLIRLYEFRRLQASSGTMPTGLQHLVVVEEAHRLLRNVSLDVSEESSNLRAQAVETFVNLFSEVRRYGQGVLVAEQIPSKLAPDVVKNSNLKIIHRMVAEEDRLLLGGATNMTSEQTRHLAVLESGTAAVFAEGSNQPHLVRVRDILHGTGGGNVTDQDVARHMARLIDLSGSLPVLDMASFGVPLVSFNAPDAVLTRRAIDFVSSELDPGYWARIILRAVHAREKIPDELSKIHRKLAATSRYFSNLQLDAAMRLVVLFGTELAIDERRGEYGWSYPTAVALRDGLVAGLLKTLLDPGSREANAALYSFAQRFKANTNRTHGPYPGCDSCEVVCLYRAEVVRLVMRSSAREIVSKLTDPAATNGLKQYRGVADTVRRMSAGWLGHSDPAKGEDNLAYCGVLTAVSGLEEDLQLHIAQHIEPHLF